MLGAHEKPAVWPVIKNGSDGAPAARPTRRSIRELYARAIRVKVTPGRETNAALVSGIDNRVRTDCACFLGQGRIRLFLRRIRMEHCELPDAHFDRPHLLVFSSRQRVLGINRTTALPHPNLLPIPRHLQIPTPHLATAFQRPHSPLPVDRAGGAPTVQFLIIDQRL